MGVIAEGILRGCQGLFTPVSLGYSLSVFNKNSTLKKTQLNIYCTPPVCVSAVLDALAVWRLQKKNETRTRRNPDTIKESSL